MNIPYMRKIDYFLGIPVCLLFGTLHRIKLLFFQKQKTSLNPNKILFIKLFGIGSIVLSLPAIQKARLKYPDAELYFLTFKGNDSVLILTDMIRKENILLIDTANFFSFFATTIACILSRFRLKFDFTIDLEFFSRFTAILSFLIGSKNRAGFYNHHTEGLYRGNFLTHKIYYNHYQHTSLAYLDLVDVIEKGDRFPYNKISENRLPILKAINIEYGKGKAMIPEVLRKFGLAEKNPLILLNPNSSDLIELRKWPRENFSILAKSILKRNSKIRIGIIGSGSERIYSESLEKSIGDERVISLAGKTSIQELLILFQAARAFVTNDSGPAHLAALTPVQIICLFGPETPELYRPLSENSHNIYLGLGCSPCVTIYNGKHTECRDNQCMKQIPVGEIMKLMKI